MAIGELTTAFETAMDKVADKVTGTNSIYDKTLTKLNTLYTDMGMDARTKNAAIMEVSAQLAVSATNAAINAAVEMAKSADMIDAQVATENARKDLQVRQKEGFNDKLKVEVMKVMGGVAQMEATAGQTQAETLFAVNKTMNKAYNAAGVDGTVFDEA